MNVMVIKNPILPGFYPDPSICRAGKYFYMVNSTFAYFPGIPVFRSRDLARWEQIGNVLERNTQVPLEGCGHSEGIYAPTIRYHEGIYYVITTNVSGGGNFIVTAENPQGPWSEPYYLGNRAEGIDPSLFFDEDGTCYYIGQRANSAGARYFGDCEIWIQRLNLEKMELEGKDYAVLHGFERNAVWPEGPHLYKKDGYYYILHAEGGTERNHCIAAARSKNIFGPYEYCPANPIFTHRHLGRDYPVTCVGHGDLTEDEKGNWYMVMLASRPEKGHTLMGRETFLAKVIWEEGWPVVNPGLGILEETIKVDAPGDALEEKKEAPANGLEKKRSIRCTFEEEKFPMQFITLRNPKEGRIISGFEKRFLRMCMNPATLKEKTSPCYMAVRQQDRSFEAETEVEICSGRLGDCAGLAFVQSNDYHIRVECYRGNAPGKHPGNYSGNNLGKYPEEYPGEYSRIRVIYCRAGEDCILADKTGNWGSVFRVKMVVQGLEAAFYGKSVRNGDSKEEWMTLAEGADLRFLSTETAGGFVGCTVGMYVSSNGVQSEGYGLFSWFSYTVL